MGDVGQEAETIKELLLRTAACTGWMKA